MARGKFWEVTFDPNGVESSVEKHLDELDNLAGYEQAKVRVQGRKPRRLNLKDKRFSDCELQGGLEKGSFTNCEFLGCRFIGTHWTSVKFSRCRFERCHFLHTDFTSCWFTDCVFETISVSAEHFKCVTTRINVSQFLGAVTTNLAFLPVYTTAQFQLSQLTKSKATLAQILYRSNEEIFGENFFAAHKELIHSRPRGFEEMGWNFLRAPATGQG